MSREKTRRKFQSWALVKPKHTETPCSKQDQVLNQCGCLLCISKKDKEYIRICQEQGTDVFDVSIPAS